MSWHATYAHAWVQAKRQRGFRVRNDQYLIHASQLVWISRDVYVLIMTCRGTSYVRISVEPPCVQIVQITRISCEQNHVCEWKTVQRKPVLLLGRVLGAKSGTICEGSMNDLSQPWRVKCLHDITLCCIVIYYIVCDAPVCTRVRTCLGKMWRPPRTRWWIYVDFAPLAMYFPPSPTTIPTTPTLVRRYSPLPTRVYRWFMFRRAQWWESMHICVHIPHAEAMQPILWRCVHLLPHNYTYGYHGICRDTGSASQQKQFVYHAGPRSINPYAGTPLSAANVFLNTDNDTIIA